MLNEALEFLAVLGIGSIVAGIISWFVNLSNHRVAWISSTRDDLSTFLREFDNLRCALIMLFSESEIPLVEREAKKQEARAAVLFLKYRILMRLNPTEALHIELARQIDEMINLISLTPDIKRIEDLISISQKVLKQEWNTKKYGVFNKKYFPLNRSIY